MSGDEVELSGPFVADGGFSWACRLPAAWAELGDRDGAPRSARTALFENGAPLGPAHSLHVEIRSAGGGRHSHWGSTLYFSASDNSDPNRNGRRYVLRRRPAAPTEPLGPVALTPPFRHVDGFCWLAAPALPGASGDTSQEPAQSRLRLFEDGKPLGPAHMTHARIAQLGGGRYSHWQDGLYFSSADGSDPNANGRRYTVALAPEAPASSVVAAPGRRLGIAIVGTGVRGERFCDLLKRQDGVGVVRLCDTHEARLAHFAERTGLGDAPRGGDYRAVLADPAVDAVVIATPDRLHCEMTLAAFAAGKDVLLEKPVATTGEDARAVARAARDSGRVLVVGFVLRDAPFFARLKEIVESGALGTVVSIEIQEQLGLDHGASFLRRWHRHRDASGGLFVHKASHDFDTLCRLAGRRPVAVAAFAGLDHFRRAAPASHCGRCPERETCPFVYREHYFFVTPAERADPTAHGLDRCVFGTDADILDNGHVILDFGAGLRAHYGLQMFGADGSQRRVAVIGTKGTVAGVFQDSRLILRRNDGTPAEILDIANVAAGGHGGGDARLIARFVSALRGGGAGDDPVEAIAGTVIGAAAEEAWRGGRIVRLAPADFGAPS